MRDKQTPKDVCGEATATQATKGFPTSSLFKINSALRERPEGRLTFVLSHFTLLHNKLINFNPMRTLSHFLLVDIKLSHDMTEINNNVQKTTPRYKFCKRQLIDSTRTAKESPDKFDGSQLQCSLGPIKHLPKQKW